MSYQIGDLEFYVTVSDGNGFKTFNVFDHINVKRAICKYVLNPTVMDNPCLYFFGDFWSRAEYEMMISGIFGGTSTKVDVYEMYIKPNFPLLLRMINQVSKASCRAWLKENHA